MLHLILNPLAGRLTGAKPVLSTAPSATPAHAPVERRRRIRRFPHRRPRPELNMLHQQFHIHGDNIVECLRTIEYIATALGDLVLRTDGPDTSVTCPVHTVTLIDRQMHFRFLPGYGAHRWNQDILGYVERSGGLLREAPDAIITSLADGEETPILAIEFCRALPAGNQAWQRHGRAFSFAHAAIPYFFVAELGGFELDPDRRRKARAHAQSNRAV